MMNNIICCIVLLCAVWKFVVFLLQSAANTWEGQKIKSKAVEEQVEFYRYYGFNPIHIFGNLYLVRYESTHFCKFSWYYPKIFRADS